MSEIKIRLTGWKAILVLVVAVAFVGYRYVAMRTTLATEAAAELRLWLAAGYISQGLPALQEAVERGDQEAAAAQAQNIVAQERIEFTSIGARGGRDDVVVRVEILVDGKPPPDGRQVRYFRMRHSLVTGWMMRYETSALAYIFKLF
ncbi:MAG: hypothetical protein GTN62_12330 [Gemmatimonadales bacterium]|nr:hypothetical protein [Gemmatimonadales bacterium]NIN12512.1 hypothetical protein [Gemmatimonadales bacterium]NIN50883.1 hypothetical protein [Gemmatimonadales bacterium]NIP08347.1 hypothetical protein [Gemmatimonadales bacterium]NIR03444.1 hypothetical protein [Gemmatimonadales bacterium]